jgi:g-D-glutamyl-meso-diaminopimelate peptidase
MSVLDELSKFYQDYKGEKGYIGSTANGKLIPYFAISKTCFPKLIVQYSIHAREYITTFLAIKQIEQFEKSGTVGTVYFIPAVNIDGIEICLRDNPLYKANANSVDLNVNFDAKWGKGKQNITYKCYQNYIGDCPFSEPESRALRDFTLSVRPDMTVSYHSKGEEIYYEFNQQDEKIKSDYALAKIVADLTGYTIKSTPDSCGGYKDWCIEKLHIPAITIEVGDDNLSHPIGKENLREIYEKNEWVICALTQELWERNANKIF